MTRKRWRRRLAIAALVGIAFLTVHAVMTLVTGQRLRATIDQVESRWGNVDPRAMAPAPVAVSLNRARALRAAVELVSLEEEDFPVLGRIASFKGEAEDAERLEVILARDALALVLLEEASRRSQSNWEIDYDDLPDLELPNLLSLRHLNQLNRARVTSELARGNADGALAQLKHGFTMAESLGVEPLMFFQIVRFGLVRRNLRTLRDVLSRGEPSELALSLIAPSLASIRDAKADRSGFIGEMKLSSLLWQFELGRVDVGVVPPPANSFLARWLVRPLLRDDFRFFLTKMSYTADYGAVPFHEREDRFEITPEAMQPRPYHFLSKIVLPNFSHYTGQSDVNEALVVLAQTAVDLRRFRLQNGLYPDQLTALEVSQLDPFAGVPLTYELTETGFLLQSRGAELPHLSEQERNALVWRIDR